MSTKSENYVVNNYPFAKKAGDRFKMDPLVILAQGSFESAWGTSNLSTKHNNFFGITAGGSKNEFWKIPKVQPHSARKKGKKRVKRGVLFPSEKAKRWGKY